MILESQGRAPEELEEKAAVGKPGQRCNLGVAKAGKCILSQIERRSRQRAVDEERLERVRHRLGIGRPQLKSRPALRHVKTPIGCEAAEEDLVEAGPAWVTPGGNEPHRSLLDPQHPDRGRHLLYDDERPELVDRRLVVAFGCLVSDQDHRRLVAPSILADRGDRHLVLSEGRSD